MPANPEIDALLAELLDSGVSPRYISRLASELDDHYADLEAEARRLGVPPDEAAGDAMLRLGRCAAIAREFELRPELKSWVYTCRWLERLLRIVGWAYLFARAPARAVAGSQAVMIRYTAATAAGASVTCGILLLLTAMLSPQSPWAVAVLERASAALGAFEIEPHRPQHNAPMRRYPRLRRPIESAAEPIALPSAATGDASAPTERAAAAAESAGDEPGPDAEELVVIDRPELAASGPLLRPEGLRLPDELYPPILPSFGSDDSTEAVAAEAARAEPTRANEHPDDRELEAIEKARPVYPIAAARRGIEGYVVVEYTVTRAGTIADPVIVESTHRLFHRAALDATRAFKYAPRIVDGEPVDVHGVRILIRFELEA
jgi:protein TonB